jgi:broad specificity phosphatase PhoE
MTSDFKLSKVWFALISFLLSSTESFVPTANISGKRMTLGICNAEEVTGSTESKRIVFIRHGQTYMNEFIDGINYGGPGFTDIFPNTSEYNSKYPDSPLSQTGQDQAKTLNSLLQRLKNGEKDAQKSLSLSDQDASFLNHLELVLVSPLSRALQTLEMGLYQHIQQKNVPIVAVPLATERVYLVSDIGKTRSEMKERYSYIDFDTAFPEKNDVPWWFTPSDELAVNYVEWRPNGEGQKYACLGEPQDYFDRRMNKFYRFLENREESTIAVVCHAGVIDWFVREIFENCELRVIPFEELNPRALIQIENTVKG